MVKGANFSAFPSRTQKQRFFFGFSFIIPVFSYPLSNCQLLWRFWNLGMDLRDQYLFKVGENISTYDGKEGLSAFLWWTFKHAPLHLPQKHTCRLCTHLHIYLCTHVCLYTLSAVASKLRIDKYTAEMRFHCPVNKYLNPSLKNGNGKAHVDKWVGL